MVEALVKRKKEEAYAHEEGDRKKKTIEKDIEQAHATIKSHDNVLTSSIESALTTKKDCETHYRGKELQIYKKVN